LSDKAFSEEQLLELIDKDRLPKHVAIIMDGNGRWAEVRGLPRIAGHKEGIQSVQEVVETSMEVGIQALTIYAFSLENWQRPAEEIGELMSLLKFYLKKELPTLMKHGIRFRTIGRRHLLPESVRAQIADTEAATRENHRMTLVIALSYGGRSEIVDAVRKIIGEHDRTGLPAESIDDKTFSGFLDTAGLADPDLMIRTSGESRISNFLLWQLAYTELYFTKTLWPDFRRRDFLQALLDYQRRERRFGLVLEPSPDKRKVGQG
jgi:undecaprenyl diphosphate synthase